MTWLDRLLLIAARAVVWALHRRVSPEEQRVWWISVSSVRPDPATFGTGVPEAWPPEMGAGVVRIAFGEPGKGGLASPPRPLLEMGLTRHVFDALIGAVIEVRGIQDIQLQALRANRGGKLL